MPIFVYISIRTQNASYSIYIQCAMYTVQHLCLLYYTVQFPCVLSMHSNYVYCTAYSIQYKCAVFTKQYLCPLYRINVQYI